MVVGTGDQCSGTTFEESTQIESWKNNRDLQFQAIFSYLPFRQLRDGSLENSRFHRQGGRGDRSVGVDVPLTTAAHVE